MPPRAAQQAPKARYARLPLDDEAANTIFRFQNYHFVVLDPSYTYPRMDPPDGYSDWVAAKGPEIYGPPDSPGNESGDEAEDYVPGGHEAPAPSPLHHPYSSPSLGWSNPLPAPGRLDVREPAQQVSPARPQGPPPFAPVAARLTRNGSNGALRVMKEGMTKGIRVTVSSDGKKLLSIFDFIEESGFKNPRAQWKIFEPTLPSNIRDKLSILTVCRHKVWVTDKDTIPALMQRFMDFKKIVGMPRIISWLN